MSNDTRANELYSIKITNLLEAVRNDDLRDIFEKFGRVADVYIPRDYSTLRNKGFAFVRYGTRDEAEEAVRRTQDMEILGQPVRCELAMYKKNDRALIRSKSRKRSRSRRRRDDSRGRDRDRRKSRSRRRRDDSRGRDRDRDRSRDDRDRRRDDSRSRRR